jgi:hypothetical protein
MVGCFAAAKAEKVDVIPNFNNLPDVTVSAVLDDGNKGKKNFSCYGQWIDGSNTYEWIQSIQGMEN